VFKKRYDPVIKNRGKYRWESRTYCLQKSDCFRSPAVENVEVEGKRGQFVDHQNYRCDLTLAGAYEFTTYTRDNVWTLSRGRRWEGRERRFPLAGKEDFRSASLGQGTTATAAQPWDTSLKHLHFGKTTGGKRKTTCVEARIKPRRPWEGVG